MDNLLSQLVCSVVARLVYKYVETVQEAPGSNTWPHRSPQTILIRPKEVLLNISHPMSNSNSRSSICFFTLLGVRIKIFLSIAKSQRWISGETQQWERKLKLSAFILDPLEEKPIMVPFCLLREAKDLSRASLVSAVPITCSFFWTGFQTACCSSDLSSGVMKRCWVAVCWRRGRAWAKRAPQTALGWFDPFSLPM